MSSSIPIAQQWHKSAVIRLFVILGGIFLWVDAQSGEKYYEDNDDWYKEYLDLVVDWEEAEIRDLRLPYPSEKQVEMRTRARLENLTDLVIEDMTEYD